MNKLAKTAKDKNGKLLKVGDIVKTISIYNRKPMNLGKILEIRCQGFDGTILKLNNNPDPNYPNYFNHRASETIKM